MLHHVGMDAKVPSNWEVLLLNWLSMGMPGPGYEGWAKDYLSNSAASRPPSSIVELHGARYDVSGTEAFNEIYERAQLLEVEGDVDLANRLATMALDVQRAHQAYMAARFIYNARRKGYSDEVIKDGVRRIVVLQCRGIQKLLRHIGGPEWDIDLAESEVEPPK